MSPPPWSLDRQARRLRWSRVVAMGVATACLSADVTQANALLVREAAATGSVADILHPSGSNSEEGKVTIVDWIETPSEWIDETIEAMVDPTIEVVDPNVGVVDIVDAIDHKGEAIEVIDPGYEEIAEVADPYPESGEMDPAPIATDEPIAEDPNQGGIESDVNEAINPPTDELFEEKPIAIGEPSDEDNDTISLPRPYVWPSLPAEIGCFTSRGILKPMVATGESGESEWGSDVVETVICVQPLEHVVYLPWYDDSIDPMDQPIWYAMGVWQGAPAEMTMDDIFSSPSEPSPESIKYFALRGPGPEVPITATPGPLPVAAALAGWSTGRRLRRRCKERSKANVTTLD